MSNAINANNYTEVTFLLTLLVRRREESFYLSGLSFREQSAFIKFDRSVMVSRVEAFSFLDQSF